MYRWCFIVIGLLVGVVSNSQVLSIGTLQQQRQSVANIAITAVNSGRAYLSRDNFQTWDEITPLGPSNQGWKAGVISPSGRVVTLATSSYLTVSTDYGQNWTTRTGFTTYYDCLASSYDGEVMYIAQSNSRVYKTTNYWESRTEVSPILYNSNWSAIGTDYSGTIVLASVYAGRIYLSKNSGSSWVQTYPKGNNNGNWQKIIVSHDASVIYAVDRAGYIYVSTDTATTWSTTCMGSKAWYGASSNVTGDLLLAGTNTSDSLYISTDRGNTNCFGHPNMPQASRTGISIGYYTNTILISTGAWTSGKISYSLDGGTSFTTIDPKGLNTNSAWTICIHNF